MHLHDRLRLYVFEQAEADAGAAVEVRPTWPKPYYTLAQIHQRSAQFRAAVHACRQGEALQEPKSNLHSDFSQLLDQIAIQSALSGDLVGFDGRHLEVGGPIQTSIRKKKTDLNDNTSKILKISFLLYCSRRCFTASLPRKVLSWLVAGA